MNPWVAFAVGVIGTFVLMRWSWRAAFDSWIKRGDLVCSEWLKSDQPRMCKNSK